MSKLEQKLKKYVPFDEYRAINNYLSRHQEKKPKENNNYIGIEIECFGSLSRNDLQKLVFQKNLEKYVMLSDDGSIRPTPGHYYSTYEIRLLIPEKKLSELLPKFGLLFKTAKLKTNKSCGLHVHIDMRYRSFKECKEKLHKFEDLLFAVVSKQRWSNQYCKHSSLRIPVEPGSLEAPDRYLAINPDSYRRHKTIEVRLHQGTVDTVKIEKWIRLLLNIVNSKTTPEIKDKKSVLSWRGLNKQLRSYVSKNFKNEWFNKKNNLSIPPHPRISRSNNPLILNEDVLRRIVRIET